ncbi:DUF4783 domain-containing protein [Mucilaginibacter sp. HMF5004]|uniref:DUF4783 domain-containing protein n=1 Tax=Mucilaginibacter rivuli TaxID=2857527 RepID=UPI001C5D73F7|nr:DUF4783 domain-containing protein [Mucilaginibacter rivuli]MBW4891411.1 DUF4783 domain-containing protein [Mucilaginibacter rivuli]
MKMLYLSFLLSLAVLQPRTDDPVERTIAFLKQGNVAELCKTLAPSIDLAIADNQDTYPKEKAQVMLNAFFAKNQPVSAKVVHRLNSNPDLLYAVIILTTKGGNYRVSFSVKNNKGVFQLTELGISEEKAN